MWSLAWPWALLALPLPIIVRMFMELSTGDGVVIPKCHSLRIKKATGPSW